jgi:uncharacterized protein (DUF58 family)
MSRVGLLEHAAGDAERRDRSRTGYEIAASRRYVAGDPRRYVHWRNSARAGRLMVKEFDASNDHSYVFAFLAGSPEHLDEAADAGRLDEAVRLAASAAKPIIAQGGAVSLLTAAGLGRSFVSWQAMMAELAVTESDRLTAGWNELRSIPCGARVLAFVIATTDAHVHALSDLQRRGSPVAVVAIGEGQASSEYMARLRQLGIPAIECADGQGGQAAMALERRAQEWRRVRSEVIAPETRTRERELVKAA